MAPKPPEFLNKIRLLDLDFVEVYNQPPRPEEFEDGGSGSDPSIDAVSSGGRRGVLFLFSLFVVI